MIGRIGRAVALSALLAAGGFAQGQPARLTLDEAIANMLTPNAFQNDAAKRTATFDAFKGLTPEQTQGALDKLQPLLFSVGAGQARYHLQPAYANLGEAALPALLKMMDQNGAWENVLFILPVFQRKALPPLLPLLESPDARVRARAATAVQALARFFGTGPEAEKALADAAQRLGAMLKDPSPEPARRAAEALAALRGAAKPAIPALAAALGSSDAALRASASAALGALGKDGGPVVSELIKLFAHPDAATRILAAQAAADIGAPALMELAQTLQAEDPLPRRMAAFAIGKMAGAGDALPAVTAALADADEGVRLNAMDAVARLNPEAAVAPVRRMLDDASPVVRCQAAAILEALARGNAEVAAEVARTRAALAQEAKAQSFESPTPLYKDLKPMTGGFLEGVVLPKFATRFGEPAGFPGCVPELQKPEGEGDRQFTPFTPEAVQPEMQLYPGAVEHYRSYWFKYVPVRSTFDAQSLVKRFNAPELPGVAAGQVAQYAEPVYWVPRHRDPRPTGLKNPPVAVVRCGPDAPVFQLDLGVLPIGLYAVRVVGAVETSAIERVRKPLYLALSVNDGLKGEENTYRVRSGYCDEFYSVAELYFHAPEKRAYRARLRVAEGSRVELLAHTITLDDVLVGIERRPIKTQMTLEDPAARAEVRAARAQADRNRKPAAAVIPRPVEEQWARDAALWAMWPRVNAQPGQTYGEPPDTLYGTGGEPAKAWRFDQTEASKAWGTWQARWPGAAAFGPTATLRQLLPGLNLMTNEGLGLDYTVADYAAGRALPDPYPHKDDGAGLWFPPRREGEGPQLFNVVANAVGARINSFKMELDALAKNYHETGNPQAARDGAIMLIRAALEAPAIDAANSLSGLVADPGPWGRDLRCRRRETVAEWAVNSAVYDRLFEAIRGNEELARSVNRFVPWVRSSADLVTLLDAYVVQNQARHILRYQELSDNTPTRIAVPAIILGDRAFTRPWMDWLFTKAYIYPNPPSGLPDLIATANDRNGVGYIASWFYCHGEEASKNGDELAEYVRAGGDPAFDLRDAARFPKIVAACYWPIRTYMAGLYWPRVGDVCGPDKGYAFQFASVEEKARRGWAWTKDPVFAWVLKNHFKRKGETDGQWAEIEKAAETVKRSPFLTQPSRVVANWMGVLESGRQYDDPRFRRAAMLRIGQGYGHQHNDTLDLQIYAHGYPFTIDDGQRSGYTSGASASTRWHNVGQVDDKHWIGASWVRSLTDGDGARYMLAEAVPPQGFENVRSNRRQVALIDAGEEPGAAALPPNAVMGAGLPAGARTPDSYVFDVVRLSGGKRHTYNFHAALDDEFLCNAADKAPSDRGKREGFATSAQGFTGTAPEVLTATWRMRREPMGTALGEQSMAPWFDAKSPRKFTRLHLPGWKGARVYTDWTFCKQWNYGFTNLYTVHETEQDSDALFPAIIEPYVGAPFIDSVRLLPVEGNEADASAAVAVEVRTVDGRTDFLFADGRPEKTRRAGAASASGEFAFAGEDKDGLRLAALSGGTLLQTPSLTLKTAAREHVAKITKVDHAARTISVAPALPPLLSGERALEITSGTRGTSFMATKIQGAQVAFPETAGHYASRIIEVDTAAQVVHCALPLPYPTPGQERGLVASDRDLKKTWRVDYLGGDAATGRFSFKLDGPVTEADFGASQSFRVWEYGVGDTVRQPAAVTLRRVGAGVFELTTDTALTLALKGAALELSREAQTWTPLKCSAAAGMVEAVVTPADLAEGRAYVRVK
jgi:HEAT repeat protein